MRKFLDQQFRNYLSKTIKDTDILRAFTLWWDVYGDKFLNEIEWRLDDWQESSAQEELESLRLIITKDANINQESLNVKRVLHHIDILIAELMEPIDYEEDGEGDE